MELALLLPLVMLMLTGTMDFSRVLSLAQEVSSAAAAGAKYGIQSTARSTDLAAMQTAAVNDSDLPGITATAARVCRCSSDYAAINCVASCASGSKMTYVEVSTQATYTSLMTWPGVQRPLVVRGKAILQAP